jgi:membrane dipeptidase
MMQVSDPRQDPDAWAARLGVSREAIDIFSAADTIDLHIESFFWTRVIGYDLSRRHGRGLLGARLYSQLDFPRMLEAGMTGGVFSIVTNPFRRRRNRTPTCLDNIRWMRALIEAHPEHLALVTDHAGYLRARAGGRAACWMGLQGGNGLDSGPGDLELIPDRLISRITLIHMLRSTLGSANSPLAGGRAGLTPLGRDYVRQMNALRILVDLSHISTQGFWDALEVHDPTLPPIVSHTGVKGMHDIWRNIDDHQIKAIADRGGVIGVVFHSLFLDGSWLGTRADAIVDHMQYIILLAGDEHVALGSDWDGFIVTPRDMPTVLELPVLVQRMLDRGWSTKRITRILGGNVLRVMQDIRP